MNTIFIEGKLDETFLKAYLTYLFQSKWVGLFKFIPTDGYTSLHKEINSFKKTTDSGFKNLVVFDADTDSNGGGFAKRQAYLLAKKQELSIDFNLFLFPNDSEDGDIETLLEKIINPKHIRILSCFEGYKNCISQYKDDDTGVNIYSSPLKKSKIYSYTEAIRTNEKLEFDFSNSEYWNLNHNYLDPLKNFLSSYFV